MFFPFSLVRSTVGPRVFSEAEHQSASSAECTEFFSGGPEFFLILVSSVLAPTFNQATPGSPPTPPSEVQVAAPRALPTPNQRQRYSVWTITPPPPAEARGPALPPLAPLPLHLNATSCIASHARHAAGPALRRPGSGPAAPWTLARHPLRRRTAAGGWPRGACEVTRARPCGRWATPAGTHRGPHALGGSAVCAKRSVAPSYALCFSRCHLFYLVREWPEFF